MKELSIEQKAKAYDEALEVLKEKFANKEVCGLDKSVLQKLFPQLKESEDEMIRKWLIGYLENRILNCSLIDEKENCKNAVAWLEKRGKNNMGISEATKQKLEDSLNKALEKETPESFNKFLDEQDELDKESEDEKIRQFLIHEVAETSDKVMSYRNMNKKAILAWLEKHGEQSPVWSEEDEARFKSCIKILQPSDGYDTINTKWLKSLKDRVQPQNIAYYNPYKEVVESIAEMCKHYDKASHSGLRDFYDNVKVKCKDAKEYDSLFPQSIWKPSDEQMEILQYLCENSLHPNKKVMPTLKSLYQDLKKLREE